MRIIVGVLVILVLAGCSGKDKIPSGILPKDKMENVLWDMIQADQFSAIYLLKDSARLNIKTENLRLYNQVFRLHQISREDFRKSFQYYEDRPDLIRTVFDSLLSRGNRLRTESYNKPVSHPAVVTPPVTPPVAAPKPTTPPGQSPKSSPVTPPLKKRSRPRSDPSANHKDSSVKAGKPPIP